jgi:hypothetical protein
MPRQGLKTPSNLWRCRKIHLQPALIPDETQVDLGNVLGNVPPFPDPQKTLNP